jgi:hypothetical protein
VRKNEEERHKGRRRVTRDERNLKGKKKLRRNRD